MDERFKIFFEHLRDGSTEKIHFDCNPDFLEIKEEALFFAHPVKIDGETYLADDTLILHLNISTLASIPCSICNTPVEVPIKLIGFYHTEPTDKIKNGYFNFKEVVRDAILLEVPSFAECNKGNCPERKEIAKFLKKSTNDKEGHQPFADIDLDQFKP